MHGVKKIDESEEEKDAKAIERSKKLKFYLKARDFVFEKVKTDCYDDEGLQATGQLLSKNPDIYTFWNYRKKAFVNFLNAKHSLENTPDYKDFSDDLEKRFRDELDLTENCISKNPKSYGAWYHRGWILQKMQHPDYQREVKQCEVALSMDERNFHCWDHWRIVCKLGSVSVEEQTKFSDKKVVDNFSNYSAWHYRSKLLPSLFPDSKNIMPISCEKVLEELGLLHNAFFTDPDDQSSWFYRNWLFKNANRDAKNEMELHRVLLDSKFGSLCLFFKKAVVFVPTAVKIALNEILLPDLQWESADSSACCSLWIAKLKNVVVDVPKSLKISLYDATVEIDCQNKNIDSVLEWRCDFNKADIPGNVELTQDEIQCLEFDLQQMMALTEMENEKKWPLLVTLMTKRVLNYDKYETEITSGLHSLKSSDSSRKEFYNDLESKWRLEKIFAHPLPSNLDLQAQGLTALYHTDCVSFFTVTQLNVSNNFLRSMSPLRYLVSLEVLKAANNCLISLNGMEKLYRLGVVDVSENSIENSDGLSAIFASPMLKKLNLSGNPILKKMTTAEVNALFCSNLVEVHF